MHRPEARVPGEGERGVREGDAPRRSRSGEHAPELAEPRVVARDEDAVDVVLGRAAVLVVGPGEGDALAVVRDDDVDRLAGRELPGREPLDGRGPVARACRR